MKTLLIYGATGYTGRMIAEQATSAGLNVVLAGRNHVKLQELASELKLQASVFTLDDADGLAQELQSVSVVLNCAGPFAQTAEPLMKACIQLGIHYLDITAEINVYRLAESFEEREKSIARALVEITAGNGEVHDAVIETVNGYSYTPLAAIAAVSRVLNGEHQPGFQTPAKVFGPDFALTIPGTRIITR